MTIFRTHMLNLFSNLELHLFNAFCKPLSQHYILRVAVLIVNNKNFKKTRNGLKSEIMNIQ